VDTYEAIVGLHIAGAVVLEISAVGLLASLVILARGGPERSSLHAVTGARLFDKGVPAGAALVLITGLYMVIDRWEMREPWLIASLGALVAVSPLAPLLISPEVKKLLTGPHSRTRPSQARESARNARLLVPAAVLAAVSVAELLVMTTKPQGITATLMLTVPPIVAALFVLPYLHLGRPQ
jgi:predicted integral membrane protein DUF2269